MWPTSSILRAITLPCILTAMGCASPEQRIKKNPALFTSLPEQVQAQVREGKVALGFTKDAVFLALGRADRTYTRKTANQSVEVWSYVGVEYRNKQQQVRGTFRYRDHKGRTRTAHDTVWVTVQNEIHYEKVRVEFTEQAVTAIEETTR